MSTIPAGFEILHLNDPVMDRLAPVYVGLGADWRIVLGFHVASSHCNGRGNCHGGTWATLADVLMGLSVGNVTGLSGPTVSMTLHYMAPATMGQWVEGRAEIRNFTPEFGFVECAFTAGSEPVLHANAVFQRKFPPHGAIAAMMARQNSTGNQLGARGSHSL